MTILLTMRTVMKIQSYQRLLGPFLFLIYINDLPDKLSNPSKLYADDCKVNAQMNSSEDHLKLQNKTKNMDQSANDWKPYRMQHSNFSIIYSQILIYFYYF
jgi:hypothetical protein